jgi:hypothetical protein
LHECNYIYYNYDHHYYSSELYKDCDFYFILYYHKYDGHDSVQCWFHNNKNYDCSEFYSNSHEYDHFNLNNHDRNRDN